MGGTSGNIGAIPITKPAVTFSPHPPGSKEDAKNSLHRGRIILIGVSFVAPVHLSGFTPYSQDGEFTCN
jgi:hypothetical protein